MKKMYLDDFSPGQRFKLGQALITADEIIEFARKWDPQPFHMDDAAARNTILGGLAASGWHTAGITMRLMVEGFPVANGLIASQAEITWPAPTRAGDVLTAEIEILEVNRSKSRPDRGRVVAKVTTRNQRGEIVYTFQPTMIVPAADK